MPGDMATAPIHFRFDERLLERIRKRAFNAKPRRMSLQKYLDAYLLPALEAAACGTDPPLPGRQEKSAPQGASSVDIPKNEGSSRPRRPRRPLGKA